ncbi:hypothetical protein ACVIW2_001161 [Bradyrhizobium huanghuaihaiense]|uniref:Uncharacterized protein n=1 Tax=Bradyrhizobium huanghuaihaiense TaxID=990078 RepID=A0A562QI87_9BRAD|nr:hypothetical protein IQ16_08407 [Bradyrhizobium huanghuaihaiense]
MPCFVAVCFHMFLRCSFREDGVPDMFRSGNGSEWAARGHTRRPHACPGQAAMRKRCGAEPGPRSRAFCCCMGPGSAAHRRRGAAPRPGHVRGIHLMLESKSRTRSRILAAHRARALLQSSPSKVPRAQGRRGAGWHPRSTVRKLRYEKLHSGIQVKPNIRPSLRSGFTAYVALSPGSDALLPPSPCGWLMRAARLGRRITAGLGAQTPGARTTRFCRTQAAPVVRALAVCSRREPPRKPPSRRRRLRPPRPIPRVVTIAIRPSDRAGMAATCDKSEFA